MPDHPVEQGAAGSTLTPPLPFSFLLFPLETTLTELLRYRPHR
jgi:hypothetical protein